MIHRDGSRFLDARADADAMANASDDASATFTARAFGATGAVSFALAVRFWKQRRTTPFKLAAASTWLTAGPAAVLWYAPRREEAEAVLRERARARGSGTRDEEIRASGVAAARAIIGGGDASGGG